MNRRDILMAGAGAVMIKSVASATACARESDVPPDPEKLGDKKGKPADAKAADPHAGHGAHGDHKGAAPTPAGNVALIQAISHCLADGEVCMRHCIALLSGGDTSMAACATSVHAMLAVCRATATIAAANADYLPDLAKLCKRACSDCEEACRKHAAHHAECRACAESCAGTLKAVAAFV